MQLVGGTAAEDPDEYLAENVLLSSARAALRCFDTGSTPTAKSPAADQRSRHRQRAGANLGFALAPTSARRLLSPYQMTRSFFGLRARGGSMRGIA
jgi:hypothetical protein